MATSTLTKQEKESTFAHTMKNWSKPLMRALKDLQMYEEYRMTSQSEWVKKDAEHSANLELDTIILYAQIIIDEAKGAKDAYSE